MKYINNNLHKECLAQLRIKYFMCILQRSRGDLMIVRKSLRWTLLRHWKKSWNYRPKRYVFFVFNYKSLLSHFHFNQADRAYEIKVTCDDKLNELLTGVEKIFRLIRCDDDALALNLIEIHKKVTINNFQLFLGIIEKKTNQMISTVTYVEPSIEDSWKEGSYSQI